uniref:Uncharacterized protein n=1 Tax=Mastacembelus armatus TaxID=205130 RepID=A0A7N8WJ06_9TELE
MELIRGGCVSVILCYLLTLLWCSILYLDENVSRVKSDKTHIVPQQHSVIRVIAVVIFVIVCALAIMARYICSRKGTYQNQEVKAAQPEDGPEFPFSSEADCQSAPNENQKEYFI